MSDQLNSFFDGATPAQINQMPLESNGNLQSAQQQHHPAIGAGTTTLQDLPMPEVEVQPEVEVKTHEQAAAPEVSHEVKESPQQMRFREVREGKLRAEWERDELSRRLQAYEAGERQRTPAAKQVEEEEDYGIAADEIIEGKHLAKIIKQVEKRAERKVIAQQEANMQSMTEMRLKMEMPDLDTVVNSETLNSLRKMYPELSNTVNSHPDLYTKAKAAYTIIKKLNIAPVDSNPYDYEADKRKIQQNISKPRAVQSVTPRQSALAQSSAYDGELTDALKAQLWKEMNVARSK